MLGYSRIYHLARIHFSTGLWKNSYAEHEVTCKTYDKKGGQILHLKSLLAPNIAVHSSIPMQSTSLKTRDVIGVTEFLDSVHLT